MNDYVNVKTHVSTRTTLLEIIDALIGVLLLGTILVISGGILYMLH